MSFEPLTKYQVWFIPQMMGAEWEPVLWTDEQAVAFEKYLDLKRQQFSARIVRTEVIDECQP